MIVVAALLVSHDIVQALRSAKAPVTSGILPCEALGESTTVAARRVTLVALVDAVFSANPRPLVHPALVLVQPGSVRAPNIIELILSAEGGLLGAVVGGGHSRTSVSISGLGSDAHGRPNLLDLD